LRTLTSRRPFTLIGILLALLVIVAFVLVALNAGQQSSSPPLTVVVATKDLQPRVAISDGSVQLKSIPVPGGYPKVYFTKLEDIRGMVPLVTIQAGQALTVNEVAKANQAVGGQSEYLNIPQGYVALTIPTSEQQGVAFNIHEDDYITVIATVAAASKVAAKTIFTNIHVLKVGTPASTVSSSPGSLTIVVTQCQAEVITWFQTYAALKYTLESYHDYAGQPANPAPDVACKDVQSAKGITLQQIQAAYPSLF
jgi:Flp pilus assembly protein CpaB